MRYGRRKLKLNVHVARNRSGALFNALVDGAREMQMYSLFIREVRSRVRPLDRITKFVTAVVTACKLITRRLLKLNSRCGNTGRISRARTSLELLRNDSIYPASSSRVRFPCYTPRLCCRFYCNQDSTLLVPLACNCPGARVNRPVNSLRKKGRLQFRRGS